MSNNVFTGPNAIVAKNTVDFVTAGLTALNTAKIFLVDATLKSYVPGRSINGISGFVAGKGYYLQALADMDLSANVAPPLAGLTQLATPGSFTVTPGNTQNALDWADVTSATSYTVDRATNSGFTTGVTLNIYTGSSSAFTDTGRTNGTQYFYRVRAIASGYSDSNYATGNGTPAGSSSTLTDAVWQEMVNATQGSGGTLTMAAVADAGGNATKTIGASGDYVEWVVPSPRSDGDDKYLYLCTTHNTVFAFGAPSSMDMLVSMSFNGSVGYGLDYEAGPPGAPTPTAGDVIRFERSGNDLLIKINGTNYPVSAFTGVLVGHPTLYIKGVNSSGTVGVIKNVKILG